jgi:hypothetical protein
VIEQPLQLNSSTSHSALGVTHDWLQPVAEVSSWMHALQLRLQLGPFVKEDDSSLPSSVSSVGAAGAVEEHAFRSATAKAIGVKACHSAEVFDMGASFGK